VMVMKSSTFWCVMPYSPSKVNRRFRGKCRLDLQGLRVSQMRNQHEASNEVEFSLHAGFSFGLPLAPEGGGDMFFRTVSLRSLDYIALYPKDRTL
jgi:hypothetical protein